MDIRCFCTFGHNLYMAIFEEIIIKYTTKFFVFTPLIILLHLDKLCEFFQEKYKCATWFDCNFGFYVPNLIFSNFFVEILQHFSYKKKVQRKKYNK